MPVSRVVRVAAGLIVATVLAIVVNLVTSGGAWWLWLVLSGLVIAAIVTEVLRDRGSQPAGGSTQDPDHALSDGAIAAHTGTAWASGGGDANSGVRSDGGAARAEHTGPATAQDPDSRATSGIDQSTGLTGMGMHGRENRRRGPSPDSVDRPGTGEANAPDLWASARDTGPAIATGGGVAISGVYIDQSVRQQAPRGPVAWPHQMGAVPGQALGFQHRVQASRLYAVLEDAGTAVVGQVLSGLGGVGKTQLAADYARTAFTTGRLDVLVWVTASSRQAVIDAYTRAAVDLLAIEPDEDAAQRFLAWLAPASSRRMCRWLVVLDDLAEPADLTGLWPPACATGRTVVTTRRRDAALAGPGRARVDVGVYTPGEAAAALHEALAARGHPAEPEADIRSLVRELGYLPLVISQAAAYMADASLPCTGYRARLADFTRTLRQMLPDPGEGEVLPDEQATTVAATWSLSVERADGMPPRGLARPMLQLSSLLDPNGIPQVVLSSPSALDYLRGNQAGPAAATSRGEQEEVTGEAVDKVLRVLHRFSLIDHDRAADHREVRIHQLVQRVIRENLVAQPNGPGDYAVVADAAAAALLEAWPQIERDQLAQILRANAAALQQAVGATLFCDGQVYPLLFRAADSLGENGQTQAAITEYTRLQDTATEQFGPDNRYSLTARGRLAHLLGQVGDPAEALDRLERLLPDMQQVLGPDDPEILTVRHNLATWRGEAGDQYGALDLFERLLPDLQQVLGADHIETLTVRHHLAEWRGVTGHQQDAADDLEELLDDMERVLGPDHPATLNALASHASWLGQAGDAPAAAARYQVVVAERSRILGPSHPDTFIARGNLANWIGHAGDPAGAVAALEQVLADQRQLLDAGSPDILATRFNLACWRREAGDREAGTSELHELLHDTQRLPSPNPHLQARILEILGFRRTSLMELWNPYE